MSTKQQQIKKPFCKVCFDARKTEKEYTSHYVRSEPGPKGKVVCPTLLKQECTYCRSMGHTPKFCSVLSVKNKTNELAKREMTKRAEQEKKEAEKNKMNAQKKPTNKFYALDMDMDDEDEGTQKEEEPDVIKEEEFPALKAATNIHSATNIHKKSTYVNKPKFMSAINNLYPSLTVQYKMPDEVNTYKQPIATLVRQKVEAKNKEEVKEAEEDIAAAEAVYDDSDSDADLFYREAIKANKEKSFRERNPLCASTMNWAAYDDEDDEDW
jgi:hypothetical protein